DVRRPFLRSRRPAHRVTALRPPPPNPRSETRRNLMFHDFNYPSILAASSRAAWEIEDVIPDGARLDFERPFMPEALARIAGLDMLDARERQVFNQIRGHDYLSIFGIVEEFILPFVLDHARPQLAGDDEQVRALLGFASEEAKHIHLFKRFHTAFTADFGHECGVIGP